MKRNGRCKGVIIFHRSLRPLISFVIVMSLFFIGLFTIASWFFPEGKDWVSCYFTILSACAIYVISWWFLRLEGLRLLDVGLSWSSMPPAVLAIAGFWVVINGLSTVLVWLITGNLAVGMFQVVTWPLWGIKAVEQWLFVGPAEELAIRAYMQNKFVALLDGERSYLLKIDCIILTSMFFAAWHIPRLLFVGITSLNALFNIISLFCIGLFLGLLYDVTRNVVFVGLLHGTVNFQPLFIPFPEEVERFRHAIMLSGLIMILAEAALYRRWARTHRERDFRPVTSD